MADWERNYSFLVTHITVLRVFFFIFFAPEEERSFS